MPKLSRRFVWGVSVLALGVCRRGARRWRTFPSKSLVSSCRPPPAPPPIVSRIVANELSSPKVGGSVVRTGEARCGRSRSDVLKRAGDDLRSCPSASPPRWPRRCCRL